ncbi:MAG: DUF4097 family beta strand repeat-containing protein [Flavobacteriales bacterium]
MKTKLLSSALVAAFILLSSIAFAAEDYYKEIRKSFAVNANVTLRAEINFANLRIETWDKNHMEIVVKIDANVKSEKRAEEIYNSVSIEEGSSIVTVRVDPKNGWKGSESVSINVEIKMPKGASLLGSQDFGNVTITNPLHGKVDFDVDYGNFDSGELKYSDNDLSISFGNATIALWSGGDIEVEYGNIKLRDIVGTSDIEDNFGNVDIRSISKGCKMLKIDCEYGNIDVNTGGVGCTFETSVSYGDIDLGGEYNVTSKETEMFSKEIRGTAAGGGVVINLDCSFGNIDLSFK